MVDLHGKILDTPPVQLSSFSGSFQEYVGAPYSGVGVPVWKILDPPLLYFLNFLKTFFGGHKCFSWAADAPVLDFW